MGGTNKAHQCTHQCTHYTLNPKPFIFIIYFYPCTGGGQPSAPSLPATAFNGSSLVHPVADTVPQPYAPTPTPQTLHPARYPLKCHTRHVETAPVQCGAKVLGGDKLWLGDDGATGTGAPRGGGMAGTGTAGLEDAGRPPAADLLADDLLAGLSVTTVTSVSAGGHNGRTADGLLAGLSAAGGGPNGGSRASVAHTASASAGIGASVGASVVAGSSKYSGTKPAFAVAMSGSGVLYEGGGLRVIAQVPAFENVLLQSRVYTYM